MASGEAGVSCNVAALLEQRIASGDICPGQKLPSQRQLAKTLGVSRASVREAVSALQSKGLIDTHHGGGSVSRNLLESFFNPALPDMDTDHQLGSLELQLQVMEMREVLEGEAAYYAAQRATDEQLQLLALEYQRMLERDDGETTLKKAKADLTFHMMIAESSHHLLVISISQMMYSKYFAAMYGVLSRTLEKTGRYPGRISQQHREIYRAITAREAEQARRAAVEHIRYTRQQLNETSPRP